MVLLTSEHLTQARSPAAAMGLLTHWIVQIYLHCLKTQSKIAAWAQAESLYGEAAVVPGKIHHYLPLT